METRIKTAKRIVTAVICVMLTAAMTLGGSVNAASALQWALEPTEVYKSVYFIDDDYWAVTDANGRIGIIASDGTVIIRSDIDNGIKPTDYLVNCIARGMVALERNGKMGVIDTNGNTVIPFEYDRIDVASASACTFVVEKDGKYGLIDSHGNALLPLEYSFIFGFMTEGRFKISKDGKDGVCDANGRILVPCNYTYIEFDMFGNKYLADIGGESTDVYDIQGNHLASYPYGYVSGLDGIHFLFAESYNHGVIDSKGNVVVPCEYQTVTPCGRYLIVGKEGKCGLIDYNGNTLVPLEYSSLVEDDCDNRLVATVDGEHYGVIDFNGNVLIPLNYKFKDSYFIPETKIGRDLYIFSEEVGSETKYGAVRIGGEVVIAPEYDYFYNNNYNVISPYTAAGKGESEGVIGENGELRIPLINGRISDACGDFAVVNYAYLVNSAGFKVTPEYGSMSFADDNALFVSNETSDYDWVYGIIDTAGNTIVPIKYTYPELKAVDSDGKCYYVSFNPNKSGSLIDVIYSSDKTEWFEFKGESVYYSYGMPLSATTTDYNNYEYQEYMSISNGNQSGIMRLGTMPGTVINKVLHTDIVCKIGGKPIRSYNIDGNTAIVAEDLINYGFSVAWNGEDRTLSISYGNGVSDGMGEIARDTAPVGSYAMDVYATDIKTYVGGAQVKGYNIGGSTIIYIDDLAPFGNIAWNGAAREITFDF